MSRGLLVQAASYSSVEMQQAHSRALSVQSDFAKGFHRGSFSSPPEVINHFKIKRHYTFPPGRTHEWPLEDRLEAFRVTETFFSELRLKVPEFLALNPTAAEVREILEAPLQFDIDFALHDHVLITRQSAFWRYF